MKCSCIVPRRRRRRHIYAWTNTSAAHTHTHLPVFEISYSPNRHWWYISLVSASFFLSFFFFTLRISSLYLRVPPRFAGWCYFSWVSFLPSFESHHTHSLILSFVQGHSDFGDGRHSRKTDRISDIERHTERERVNAERMLLLLLWLLRMTLFLQQRFLFFFPPLFSTHFYVENNISWRYLSFIHFMWKNTPFSSRWSFAFFFSLFNKFGYTHIAMMLCHWKRSQVNRHMCDSLMMMILLYTVFSRSFSMLCLYIL